MKALTKEQSDAIDAAHGKLEDAKRVLQEKFDAAQAVIDEALVEFNSVREDIAEDVREIWGKLEDYENERSDKWRESDAGEAFISWTCAVDEVANTLETEFELILADQCEDALSEIDTMIEALADFPREVEE